MTVLSLENLQFTDIQKNICGDDDQVNFHPRDESVVIVSKGSF